jgi:hypothetical protein
MPDSKSTHNRAFRLRLDALAVALVAMLALACVWSAPPARADGDPASDVLATQQLFLPQDAPAPPAQQTQLTEFLQEAARGGYPIRVALIASATDLGSVTALWRQPQLYARFLGQELSLAYHGPLLVVMPNGFGLYHLPPGSTTHLATANTSAGLVSAAVTAVRRLAAAAGHPLALPKAKTTKASGNNSAAEWIAFALGALAIAAAWTASLRTRPLNIGRRKATSA